MCENIKNDFPVEMSTSFNEEAEKQKEVNRELMKSLAGEIVGICNEMLCANFESPNERLQRCTIALIGIKGVITRKLHLELPLTKEETNFLIEKLKK
jgi:hypothetical protein